MCNGVLPTTPHVKTYELIMSSKQKRYASCSPATVFRNSEPQEMQAVGEWNSRILLDSLIIDVDIKNCEIWGFNVSSEAPYA